MLKRVFAILLLCVLFPVTIYAQSQKNLKKINEVWAKFYQAFDSLDYTLMAQIHSKELIRIGGGQSILDYNTYIENYKQQFQNSKENNTTSTISLRFFERISNDSVASDRGIYRLIVNKDTQDEQSHYGQFHVIFKKEAGDWKITMDYDATEGNTINEVDYEKAVPINDFRPFMEK
ncbi:nuclear transport factor 2 family protein [Ulvibacter antarcticus]|uniref:Uncharacterized protein DUF4440 n=1 Tax=Ulvibacter antarcticus TaxID=442714 RepID=A0A3L9YVV4_9FLAO|nr:nuclear transport factor 2 family protein [Ulvibacter antarcticus]RMA64881.1 uncharacterized protein DUF4440 [Ulvibacter antarcticus]